AGQVRHHRRGCVFETAQRKPPPAPPYARPRRGHHSSRRTGKAKARQGRVIGRHLAKLGEPNETDSSYPCASVANYFCPIPDMQPGSSLVYGWTRMHTDGSQSSRTKKSRPVAGAAFQSRPGEENQK